MPGAPGPELWAGVEASHVRIGDRDVDQLDLTGHAERIGDLELIADLGVRAVRYPVLWEHCVPDLGDPPDWSWTDERLGRLRDLGIRPIVGLLHHGNGPRGVNLLHPGFPGLFAKFARDVAERYPWVDAFVPINEPLTTARFAGLYGIWFPHRSDPESFVRILLQQLHATALAMREIRGVNPRAELIQNEDIGTIGGTPALADRAAHENERRWLTFDLLCGRASDALRQQLLQWGAPVDQFESLLSEPCPPDVIGVDHYLTSDRLLDERLERYPAWAHGGEEDRRWADVEAVRATAEEPAGVLSALRAAWDRYRRPLALTEAHLGCTREEQLRWLQECWDAAHTLCAEGADVRAVCSWMLFGGFEWNTLLTGEGGFYEAGAFDLRGGGPRPTAIARWIRDVATSGRSEHPVLADAGWWRRRERLLYPPVEVGWGSSRPVARRRTRRTLVIVGEATPLVDELVRACEVRGLAHDVLQPHRMNGMANLLLDRAWAVIEAGIHGHPFNADTCARCDNEVPQRVALAARERGLLVLSFSSHLVFHGQPGGPFSEGASPARGNRYARRERAMATLAPDVLIVRTGPLFGGTGAAHGPAIASLEWGAGRTSPTYLPDAVNESLDLLIDGERDIWHVANRGSVTPEEFLALASSGRPPVETPLTDAPETSLLSERGSVLPMVEDALLRWRGENLHRGFPLIDPAWLAAGDSELTGPAFSSSPDLPTSTRSPIPDELAG